jgi:post-segregation antitoxin (ccd killing protein)
MQDLRNERLTNTITIRLNEADKEVIKQLREKHINISSLLRAKLQETLKEIEMR